MRCVLGAIGVSGGEIGCVRLKNGMFFCEGGGFALESLVGELERRVVRSESELVIDFRREVRLKSKGECLEKEGWAVVKGACEVVKWPCEVGK